jgi:hypothetical protein
MATYSSKKYPSGSVTSAQLADGTVVAVDLADGAITSAKLNSTVDLSGKTVTYRSIVAGDIASNAITTAKIADGAVVTADLAANAVTPAKMANSGLELGMRNAFINGNFDVWQRSTSASHTGIWSVVSADRWGGHFDGGTAGTYARSTNVPNTNSVYSMRVQGASGGTSAYLDQRIEAVNGRAMINAGSATVSGWVRRSGTATAAISLNLITPTALDNFASYNTIGACFSANNTISGNGTVSSSTMTLTTADTWYYFTMTDTSWATRTGIANGAQIYFALGGLSSTSNYYEFSQLQIEAGPTATPFEFRQFGTEVALCQRYYWNPNLLSDGTYWWANPIELTTNYRRFTARFPVIMRIPPTVTISVLSNGSFGGGMPSVGLVGPQSCIISGDVTASTSFAYITSFAATSEL